MQLLFGAENVLSVLSVSYYHHVFLTDLLSFLTLIISYVWSGTQSFELVLGRYPSTSVLV